MAPLVRTGGSRHTGLAALPHRNIHLADAIIDRIAHDSYRINITSIDAEHDRSMREVYGLDKALRE